MTATPAISIIIRTLGRRHLADALESLCAQTRRDFEVIVVDMSEGANAETLAQFASRLSLRVLPTPRVSRPKALNIGIAAASAPRVGILDDDNLYDPDHIATLLRGNASYVYTGVRHVSLSPNGERLSSRDAARPFDFDDLLMGNFIYATGSAYRKDLWQRLGGYDERFDVFEDWDFLIRAAQLDTIEFLGTIGGESRKFTGSSGTSTFDLEIADLRRCQAGIYWKHRRLYFADRRRERFRLSYAAHFAKRTPARSGLLAVTLRGWRVELFADLLAWFLHNLRHAFRSH